jgi:hypothetical protein
MNAPTAEELARWEQDHLSSRLRYGAHSIGCLCVRCVDARESVPRLVARVRELEAMLARIVDAHDAMMAMHATRFPAHEQAAADASYTDAIEDARKGIAKP